jgi:ribosomal protein S18 acetylase RimI-like enzyme
MTSQVQAYSPGELDPRWAPEVWELLIQVNHEFVPPLSSRGSTTAKQLDKQAGEDLPHAYYSNVLGQHNLLACAGPALLGLASFILHHQDRALLEWGACTYLSTIAVNPAYRRDGVGLLLYQHLISLSRASGDLAVATRTWGTNISHLALLSRLGFVEITRIANHRGPGIDTVYLIKPH